MTTPSEAIAFLLSLGLHAQSWNLSPAQDGIAVASGIVKTDDGIPILQHCVFVAHAAHCWRVTCDIPGESKHDSLKAAVDVAAALVSERTGIPWKWLERVRAQSRRA
jgi:hypothetical protein